MNRIKWAWLIAMLSISLLAPAAQEGETPSAQEILQAAVHTLHPPIFQAQVHLEDVRPDEEPLITLLKVWVEGSDKALIEVQSEGVQQGQKILRVGDEVLILFPKICKVLPLAPQQSLFGTVFNVGDLARVDLVADYQPTRSGSERSSKERQHTSWTSRQRRRMPPTIGSYSGRASRISFLCRRSFSPSPGSCSM